MSGDRWRDGDQCILGPEEYDGGRYCYRHYGFREKGFQVPWCDNAPQWKADVAPKKPQRLEEGRPA